MVNFSKALYNHRRNKALNKLSRDTPERVEMLFGETWKVKPPKSASQCEAQIIEFLGFEGHQAQNVKTSGTYRDDKKSTVDVLGRVRITGSGTWTHSQATVGAADISSTIYGAKVDWEVKFSEGDSQKEAQKVFQANVEMAGGNYLIVRSPQDFYEKYLELIETEKFKMFKRYYERTIHTI